MFSRNKFVAISERSKDEFRAGVGDTYIVFYSQGFYFYAH